jgi:methyl-accepting chemotaxis protein PixJ
MGWTKSLGLPIIDTCFKDSRGSGISGYDTGRIISTPDVTQAGLTPCHLKMLQRFEVKANLVVPIVQGAKVWGLLIAHQCTTPRNWQESEINLFYQVSTQLTVAIQQAEFVIQQQQKGREERDNLLAVVDKVRRAATLADIFRTVTQEVRQLLKCDRVGLFKFAEDFSGEFVSESVAKGWRPLVGTERAQVADTYLAQNQGGRYSRNESHIVTDIYQTGFDSCHIDLLEQFQARAYIIVPVFKEQKLWGLFAAYQNDGPRSWEESEVNLLYQIAIQFTVSLQVNESLQQAQLLAEAARQQELAKQQELLQQQEFARQQREAKEFIQQRALDLMLEVDPVSKGDLTVRARVTNDEIGTIADSYNATIGSLRKIVTQVQVAAQQVVQTTTGGSTQVESLSQEALAQAQTLSETVSLVARVALSIEEVAASARKAELAVQQSTLTLKVGDQAMDRTVNGILIIRETVAETAKKIKRLSESSQKISKVVSLIANFAAQTNLLALNAAIEAARAGEYGRGFAVVADEVRSLARQSAQATAEIEKLVEGIQAETKEVALAMELGTEQVVNGTRLVGETRQNLTQIAASSNEISSLVQAIAQAAYGQTQASQEITQAIRTVATGAQQTSVESIQTAAVFKELLAVAQELQVSVGKFKVG